MTMSESSAFGYEDQVQDPPNRPAAAFPPGQYKFTPEELRVLQECNTESFFKRSLPIGTLLGLGSYVAMQKGALKPNPRFGPFPKVTLAVVLGYFIGKLSYQQACAEKFMAMPGSYIGQLLRDKRDGKVGNVPTQSSRGSMFGANPGDIYSDAGPGSSLDLDTDRPLFNEDSFNSNDSNEGESAIPPESTALPSKTYTYEELRRMNRAQHQEARQDPYKLDQAPPRVARQPAPAPPQEPQTNAKPKSTNKYGDVME